MGTKVQETGSAMTLAGPLAELTLNYTAPYAAQICRVPTRSGYLGPLHLKRVAGPAGKPQLFFVGHPCRERFPGKLRLQ